jgi:LmeA-like phospholipid-binding
MPDNPSAPESGTGSSAAEEAAGGPVLALLARGLELWLRQQCDSIGELQIDLEGHAVQLLRGRLQGVRLRAREVVFRSLELESVVLRSDPIQVRMGALLLNRGLQLDHPFAIRGVVAFSAEGLSRCLSRPPWSELGDALAETLLGISPLGGLRFEGERVIVRSSVISEGLPLERRTRMDVEDGGLVLRAECEGADEVGRIARLPRDPNLRFERADVGGGLMELHGLARVTP